MGNSFGCSASGERLVSAARDGDFPEALALLDFNPLLAKYSTFGALNSPLHFAAAKGHTEIVNLLLEHGADVNIRNYCGQTALMQASRYGHWEVVQTLLLYKANVSRADYLNRRTAFHFAAVNGHARCIRLLVADYIPSAPYRWNTSSSLGKRGEGSTSKVQPDQIAMSKLVSKAADGGITALHLAALNGHVDCLQLLLDLLANVSAATFHYGTAIDLIGAGSTPLHYAACGGSLQCCQVLIARGASRTALNCNGWIPWDVARVWGRHWLENLLAPNSQVSVPLFSTSRFLSLPLMSIMEIARHYGWKDAEPLPEGSDHCAVCLEYKCTVAAEGCGHELCTKCALYLCSTSNNVTEVSGPSGSVPCPLCRHGIVSFIRLEKSAELNGPAACSLSLCASYAGETRDGSNASGSVSRTGRNKISPVSTETIRTVMCTGFSGLNLPLCTCNEPFGSKPSPVVHFRSQTPEQSSEDHYLSHTTVDAAATDLNVVMSNQSLEHERNTSHESPRWKFPVAPWRCQLTCK